MPCDLGVLVPRAGLDNELKSGSDPSGFLPEASSLDLRAMTSRPRTAASSA